MPSYNKEALGLLWEASRQGTAQDIVSEMSNLGSNNPFKGPTARSLFYEAGRRNPGKYGQYLFYSLGSGGNDFIDAYYRSESQDYNTRVSSIESKNPSAGFLVNETLTLEMSSDLNTGILSGLISGYEGSIVGGLSAPYYWKDFLYCKHYGTIPNNYMITLRRYPTPVLDNLSIPAYKKDLKSTEAYTAGGVGRPVAQAVTWFGGNTSNTLSSLIGFTTGIQWDSANQPDVKTQEAFTKGFFQDGPVKWIGGALQKISDKAGNAFDIGAAIFNGAIAATDVDETLTKSIRAKNFRDNAKERGGLLGEYIWVPVDVVSNGYKRGMGLTFSWDALTIVFEYELSSVGEVNSKAALLDIMGNLLSIGTNYGNFLTPDIRYNNQFPAIGFPGGEKGLNDFYNDPLAWITTYGAKLANLTAGSSSSESQDQGSEPETIGGAGDQFSSDQLNAIRDIYTKIGKGTGSLTEALAQLKSTLGDDASRLLKFAVTSEFLSSFQEPVSFLTGAPIGEWHLTIGNPCNPIAMIGNLICDGVSIEFGDVLGPDDFPTTLKATFTLKHARDRERGEIESIFNRGDGRLYQTAQPTSANQQSFDAVSDVNGNRFSEEYVNQALNGGAWGSQLDGLGDQQGPTNP
jgi:hypothetical protein